MDFQIPETIADLSDEDLASAIESAFAAGAELSAVDDAEITDEQIENLTAVGTFLRDAKAEQATRAEAAQARAESLAQARAAVAPEPAAEVEEPEAEEIADEVVEPEVVEPQAEIVEPEVVEVEAPEPVAVAASATPEPPTPTSRKKSTVARTAQGAAEEAPVAPVATLPSITAAADALGLTSGTKFESLAELVPAAVQRFGSMSMGRRYARNDPQRPAPQRFGLANIGKVNQFNTDNYRGRMMDLIRDATNERSLSGGSLTAAGGWCTPSETLYSLCGPLASSDGIIDVPEIQVRRGGVNFTKGIDWAAIFADLASVGGIQTEAQAEAGTVKVCNEVDCPEWEDVRLDAVYLCIKHGILTESAFPELLNDFMQGMLLAHQAKIGNEVLTRILALVGAAQTVADVWPNALSVLHALELVLAGYRQQYRMSFNSTLEVVLPHWMIGVLRADLANRNGVELTNVSDQQIIAHFATRKMRVQFVYGWQDLAVAAPNPATPVYPVATDYPDTVQALVYPAGTYVKGTSDVIRLDTVYDAPTLETNTYTAMFTEEGLSVMNPCYDGRRISLPLAVTGRTGAADIANDFGTAAA